MNESELEIFRAPHGVTNSCQFSTCACLFENTLLFSFGVYEHLCCCLSVVKVNCDFDAVFSEYSLEHTSDIYCDVTLSDGAESVMNKWAPPAAVSVSS